MYATGLSAPLAKWMLIFFKLARLLRCSANSSFKLNHLRHRLPHLLQLRLRPGRCSGFDFNGEFANDISNYFAYDVFVALASTPMANSSTSTQATACTPTFGYPRCLRARPDASAEEV